jgi:hypothetical protein
VSILATTVGVAVGVALILAALRDIFQTLFHPSGKGIMSHALTHAVWRTFRRAAFRYPTALQLAGPVGFLATIVAWVASLVLGWAFVYWPHLPEGFSFDVGMNPSANAGFLDAVYFSTVSLSTLGYGDITPGEWWLRVLAPVQALTGFGVLTASITWLLSIYPALSSRRSLADEIMLVRRMEKETGTPMPNLDADTAQQILGDLASRLVAVRSDLIKFPSAYYFHGRDEESELSRELPYLLDLAERAKAPELPPNVRARAVMLREAIDEFSTTLSSRFLNLPPASTEEVVQAYARDHLHAVPPENEKGEGDA